MKPTLIVVALLGCINSCTYDNLEYGGCPDVEGCADIPNSTSFTGYQEYKMGVHYGAPCFNPSNPNEFVYFEQDWRTGLPENKLVFHNIEAHESHVILEDVLIIDEPIWTVRNEIYFLHSSWDIYRIKPDGSGYENVTNRGGCLYPTLKPDGTLLYFYYNPSNENPNGLILNTDNLEVIDTISANSCSDWSVLNDLATGEGSTFVGIQDIFNNQHQIIYDYEIPNYTKAVWDVKFSNNGKELFYSAYTLGIHKVDIASHSHTQLKWGCDTRDFRSISMHPNGKQILVQLVKNEKISESRINVTSEIWMMSTDGCDSYRILP
ncbi:MAG: hypothetical protein RL092_344 [Bacteroidota bacterium]|jgi:hypothetical protein